VPDRLERLLNLTAALLTASSPLTAADIAVRVPGYPDPRTTRDAFHRAFERDKAALREMGIPLRVLEVPGTDPPESGYMVRREDYALHDPGLDPDEMAALQLALAAVRLDGASGSEALLKLGGAGAGEPLGPGSGAPIAALPAEPSLVPLFGAVAERAPVEFAYRGEARHVDPHRLSFSRGHWYLDGYDHDRDADRQFRLDRIRGDVTVGAAGSFERPAPATDRAVSPWQLGGDDPVEARVTVDASQAEWALAALPEGSLLASHADGSVDLVVTVTNREGFRSFVLGFLDHAVVQEPPELRQAMVEWLRTCADGSALS
jgi:predicted DNA-binding transcriptional regulator YafY